MEVKFYAGIWPFLQSTSLKIVAFGEKLENDKILSLPKIYFQLPWIAEFIMESGWAQEILSDLSKVHRGGLEIGVKAAFDDLLSSLVASGGQDVIDEFQNVELFKSVRHIP